MFTKAELKALLSRCEQHTGVRASKVLIKAIDKLRALVEAYHGGDMSLVRRNLMEREGYSPYCGAERCLYTWPRTSFDGEQFKCRCGWRSSFEPAFIAEYKAKWGKS